VDTPIRAHLFLLRHNGRHKLLPVGRITRRGAIATCFSLLCGVFCLHNPATLQPSAHRGHLGTSQLLEQVREAVRTRHYSIRTEEAYIRWIREYILFFDKRHPAELGAKEVSAFISYLAVKRNVASSTQNQALSALLFLYREVLALPIGWVEDVERAKRPKRLPVVLTREEVRAVLSHMRAETWLMASLLYGSGLRLMECVRLRVKDVDFAQLQITVREGKGDKDRITMLPPSLVEHLRRQSRGRRLYFPALTRRTILSRHKAARPSVMACDSGQYEAARETPGELWPGLGERPDVKRLPPAVAAEVLLQCGALTGWLGSARNV
jgi:integrase